MAGKVTQRFLHTSDPSGRSNVKHLSLPTSFHAHATDVGPFRLPLSGVPRSGAVNWPIRPQRLPAQRNQSAKRQPMLQRTINAPSTNAGTPAFRDHAEEACHLFDAFFLSKAAFFTSAGAVGQLATQCPFSCNKANATKHHQPCARQAIRTPQWKHFPFTLDALTA